ncbi:MAG: hypothetical protein ACJLTB_06025 [Algoriphagus aquaeductus]|uniref:hypothetical protein n=1 Tax=Algoriphagus aquaeductus TaxID=475299 RepID=UPI0038794090
MNKFLKLLPALALVLAAAFAVAFSFPKTQTGMFGKDGTIWYDVTETEPDNDTYLCDQSDPEGCLYDAPFDVGNPIGGPTQGLKFIVQNSTRLTPAQ